MAGNSICLFSSYFTGNSLPYYVCVYLIELKKFVKDVVLISVQDNLDEEGLTFLKKNGIILQTERNEGFDFGAWYKTFQKINISEYDSVLLVNDSCVLFRSLDPFFKWASNDPADVKGMTYSEAVTPHIQSYFMMLNRKAIDIAVTYFKEQGIKEYIEDVIKTYELGLNKRFTDSGLKLSAFVNNGDYKGEFSPYYKCVDDHLQQGIPLVKKKILFAAYRKDELPNLARMGLNINVEHYYLQMKQKDGLVIDLEKLQRENPSQMSPSEIFVFGVKRSLIKVFRPFYKALKK